MTTLVLTSSALALPSFARQTGQECAACHIGFPELTPYGRYFKLSGYTIGGGSTAIPAFSAMAIGSYTQTKADEPGQTAGYGANNNAAFEVASLFYGGRLFPNMGAFIQTTYDNIAKQVHWDNLDVRYARFVPALGDETILGVSINNNPTLSDVWNSTPAWGYPYQQSSLAATPGAAPLIMGGLAQKVLGINAYGYFDRTFYVELGAYKSLSTRTGQALGVDFTGFSIDGAAPYARVAYEPKWGRYAFEIGAFGLTTNLLPGRERDMGLDRQTDYGVDAQLQFLDDYHYVTVQGSWIEERDQYTASFNLGNASNINDRLRSQRVKASYWYDQTYALTGGWFRTSGTSDENLYSGLPADNNSPNSSGLIGEINYMPFNHGGPKFWPWANMKLGLQYIYYNKFNGASKNYDGMGRNATDNNSLYFYIWTAF